MSRIPETFLKDLLAQLDIVEVVRARAPLKKAGQNWSACCPFHQEKTPSFTVSPQKQFYHCFGCGAHGDALRFVQEFDGLSFVGAVEKLASELGLSIPREESLAPSPDITDAYALLSKAKEYFSLQLQADTAFAKQVRDYLKRRGFDAAACAHFEIGCAPPGWDGLIRFLGGREKAPLEKLKRFGLVAQSEGSGRYYDRFRERVIFPIRDKRGRVIAFGGRVVDDSKPKYLNSPETPLFQKRSCLYGYYEAMQVRRGWRKAVVVEGYLDVMALSTAGIRGCFATLGTAVTSEHIKLLFRQTDALLFCFDGDAAGRRAAWQAAQLVLPFMEGARSVSFLFLPSGEDPDSYIHQYGASGFKHAAQQAFPLSAFIFDSLKQQLPLDTLDARARFVHAAKPLLDQLPEAPLKTLMQEELQRLTRFRKTPYLPGTDSRPPRSLTSPAQLAIALLLEQPALYTTLVNIDWLSAVNAPGVPQLHALLQALKKTPDMALAECKQIARGAVPPTNALGPIMELPLQAQKAEFLGAIERLAWLGKRQLAEKLIQKNALTAAEKHQLKSLLASLEQRERKD